MPTNMVHHIDLKQNVIKGKRRLRVVSFYEDSSHINCCPTTHTHTHTNIYIYIYIYIFFGPVKPELGVIPSGQEGIQA